MENYDSKKVLADFVFTSRYARYSEKLGRRETWEETVTRVLNMHLKKFKHLDEKYQNEIKWAFDLVKEKKVVPSMRSLQFGGRPIEAQNTKMYNCSVKHVSSLRSFSEIFHLLLCGTGVGFGVSKHFLNRLPDLVNKNDRTGTVLTYVIEDTIEGWADSVEVLMSCYFKNTPFTGRKIIFDYSRIRRKGEPLKTSGGKAPGYLGLKHAHTKIKEVLSHIIEDLHLTRIRSIDAYDILMHVSDAVLSGGIRRCIAKGSKVLTRKGSYKNIENLTTSDYVSTDGGWKKIKNIFVQGSQETILIKHNDGEIICTPNHRIAVLKDGFGNFDWKLASELIEGDRLLYIKNESVAVNEAQLPSFIYDYPQNSTTCKDILIPELDESTAWLLGVIQGDGYVYLDSNSGQVNIAVHGDSPQMAIECQNQLKRFGVNVYISEPTEEDYCFRVKVKSKQLATYFYNWLKQPKTSLKVPECIKDSNSRIKISYLQGILDSDGYIGNRCQQLVTTVYYDFAKELQSLLYSVGICSRFKRDSLTGLKDNWQPKYCLYIINNKDREEFNSLSSVGFKKFFQSKCNRLANSYPIEFLSSLKNKPKNYHKFISTGNKNITKETWEYFFGESNIVPMSVVSIEKYNVLETYDIEVEDNHNFICEGILVHNSASICIFDKDDKEMMNAKTYFNVDRIFRFSFDEETQKYHGKVKVGKKTYELDLSEYEYKDLKDNNRISWFYVEPQRGRSNNSVLLMRKDATMEDFKSIIDKSREFGEPGFIFANHPWVLVNPCAEISFIPVTDDGVTGVQYCNLSSLNGVKITSLGEFKDASKAATIIGTLQATYTEFPYQSPITKKITEEESLLGVSITGMMDNPHILLDPKNQRECAQICIETNKKWAKILGINPAARITCIKPEGSSSTVLESASGIHPHHARKYFRRVQCNKLDPVYRFIKKHNPQMCEDSVWSATKTDGVVTFPIEVSDKAIVKKDLNAIKHLEYIKSTQINWVNSGTTDVNKKPINHSVSCTVIVKKDEWDEVIDYLYKNKDYFTAVSLIAHTGDKDYKQAPMEEITNKEDDTRFEDLKIVYTKMNYKDLKEEDDNTNLAKEVACSGGACEIL